MSEVGRFAEAHELSEDEQAELETAMVAMHDRMTELGPPGPPGPGGPPEEILVEIEASFATLESDVAEILEPELAEAFTEQMKPPPLRHRLR